MNCIHFMIVLFWGMLIFLWLSLVHNSKIERQSLSLTLTLRIVNTAFTNFLINLLLLFFYPNNTFVNNIIDSLHNNNKQIQWDNTSTKRFFVYVGGPWWQTRVLCMSPLQTRKAWRQKMDKKLYDGHCNTDPAQLNWT